MAEIILPPEETPQTPELNIDKPTTNSKVITIEFEAKKTNKVSTKDTNQQLYTTDTDAWFEFKETSLEGANGTYSVVFRNRHDGSIFQRTGDVVNGVAYYKIPHQEIRHAGAWRGQIVYTLENGNTTAREFGYDVKGHILDGKDVREIVVEDFETLMSQLNSMKDNAEQELAGLVNTAEQNETDRQTFFDDLVEDIDDLQANYQELLDTGVLQTNINTKLEQLEEEYAPKLTEVTAQLEQTATKEELDLAASLKRDKRVPISLNDAGPDLLAAVQNKEGETTFNLLSEPRYNSVTPPKTTFLRESTNLYNPQFNTVGYVITADGSVTANPSYTLTGKFDLVEGMPVHYAGFVHAAFSDEAGNFIQRVDLTSPIGTTGSLVPPIGAKKVQFTFMNTQAFKLLQFNYGDELLPYEPYYVELENVRVGSKDLENEAVTEKKIKDKVVTKKKVNFIDSGTNLYNPEFDVAGQVIDAFGNIVQNQSYNMTGTYPVSPGETIHQAGFTHYAQLDSEGNFLRRRDLLPQGSSFTIPADCHKIQYNYQPTSQYRNRQFNKGDKLLPYEPYEEVLDGVGLSNAEVEKIGKKLDLHKIIGTEDRPMIDIPINEIYEELSEYSEITDFGGNVKSVDVYRLFDDLVANHPEYLKVIGTAMDDFGNEIKAYSTTLTKPSADVQTTYPKIFITTGTHGYEHPPAMYLYFLIKSLCERWGTSETLEVMRWNVEWIFIPVVNPSGWDDFTRKNRNGIDLNRNFPEGFVAGTDPSSTTYGGTEPLSEPESRFVKSVFDEHSDIDIMYDFHNFSGTEDTDFFIWIPTSQGAKVQHMSQMLISRMTRRWRKEYAWIPTDNSWFAGYTDSTSGGMIADYARSQGVDYSATFEVGGKWWLTDDSPYSVLHKQTGMEAFVNWLQISLLEVTR